MSRRRQQQYSRLAQDDIDGELDVSSAVEAQQQEDITASQFARPPPKIPYKAILLSLFLFVMGSVSGR